MSEIETKFYFIFQTLSNESINEIYYIGFFPKSIVCSLFFIVFMVQ